MEIKLSSKLSKMHVVVMKASKSGPVFFNKEKNKELKKEIKTNLKFFNNFSGKKGEQLFFNIGNQKVFLLGLSSDYDLEELRIAYSMAFKAAKAKKEFFVSCEVPKPDLKGEIIAVVEGLNLTDYVFDKYKSKKDESDGVDGDGVDSGNDDDSDLDKKVEVTLGVSSKFKQVVNETLIITNNTKIVRDLVNENSNIVDPLFFEDVARKFAKKHGLKIRVLDGKQIKKQGLGLLGAVGQGSSVDSRLIIVEYNGDKTSFARLALVGKGITFDTGGINLKPTGYLEDMRTDMGGAASVYGIFKSAVELKLKKNLVLVIAAAENAISAGAYKPGDIFVSYSGKSCEVLNTDAEGRLVLADALSYVQDKYKITSIIDMATLTGACLAALGPNMIAIMGNDAKFGGAIFDAGERTSERGWRFPIYDEHRDTLKSKFADIKNHGGKFGGTIAGGAFLEAFINKDVKWVHMDIAGAARSRGKQVSYVPAFGTGKGVRLVVDYLRNN